MRAASLGPVAEVMRPAIIPELSVRDLGQSLHFYTGCLPFAVSYQRPEEGFAFLELANAALMLDELGCGRSFEDERGAMTIPFGRGVNLQIEVFDIASILEALKAASWPLFLPLEDRWYRRGNEEAGNRQFVVADPDGYLLRFFQDLGARPAASP